jgi:hypothetical protein
MLICENQSTPMLFFFASVRYVVSRDTSFLWHPLLLNPNIVSAKAINKFRVCQEQKKMAMDKKLA